MAEATRIDVRAGMVFATGPQVVTWAEVREPTEVVEIYPDPALMTNELKPVSGGNDPVVEAIAAKLKQVHLGLSHFRRMFRRYTGMQPSAIRSR